MNWADFQTYNESPTKAFEVLCNQLFENSQKKIKEYSTHLYPFIATIQKVEFAFSMLQIDKKGKN